MNPNGSVDLAATNRIMATNGRVLGIYFFLVVALSFFTLSYGFSKGEVTERESNYLLSSLPQLPTHSTPRTSLVIERLTSLTVALGLVTFLSLAMKRTSGWSGVGAMLVCIASSPVMISLASTATPDICLVALLSTPFLRIVRRPSAFFAVLAGALLLSLGILAEGDLVLFGGTYLQGIQGSENVSLLFVGLGIVTVVSSWLVGITVQAWLEGKLDADDSRLLRLAAAGVVLVVPFACIVIGSARLMNVFQYLERMDITLACAWIAIALAVGQIRLRMPEAHFFPILLVVVAAKITWVHALQPERDVHQGSAIVARAIAHAISDRGTVLIDTPVDPIFRWTLLTECAKQDAHAPKHCWMIVAEDEHRSRASAPNEVRRFISPDGRKLILLKSEISTAAESASQAALVR